MILRLLSLFLSLMSFAMVPVAAQGSTGEFPGHTIPEDLTRAWLRFHSANLCQEMDAVFVFREDGMEIRSTVEDDSRYRELERLIAPLRASYKIDLLRVRPEEETPDKEKNTEPPASLWENIELRAYLGDPHARALQSVDFDESRVHIPQLTSGILKQRLIVYAEQTLAANRKIERLAADIPILTRAAMDSGMQPSLRAEVKSVCREHAREMEKTAKKLSRNLEPALPRDRQGGGKPAADSVSSAPTILAKSEALSEFAREVAKRVHQFIHPEQYTVNLDELRRPSLIESLKALQNMSSEFEKSLSKAR